MAVLDEMKNLENQKKEFMAQLGEVYYKNCKADGADVPGEAAVNSHFITTNYINIFNWIL